MQIETKKMTGKKEKYFHQQEEKGEISGEGKKLRQKDEI